MLHSGTHMVTVGIKLLKALVCATLSTLEMGLGTVPRVFTVCTCVGGRLTAPAAGLTTNTRRCRADISCRGLVTSAQPTSVHTWTPPLIDLVGLLASTSRPDRQNGTTAADASWPWRDSRSRRRCPRLSSRHHYLLSTSWSLSVGPISPSLSYTLNSTQRAIPPGSVNEYQRNLGSKRAYHAMH